MTPRFASAVDPIVLYVLELLERIAQGRPARADEERDQILNRFRAAEAMVSEKPGWELAKYALAAWIDDMLVETPWEGRNWWENNSLEFAFFKTHDRAIQFFVNSDEAAKLTHRDALEVFYVCVVLGFRGLYAQPEAVFLSEQLKQPPDIESWARRVSRSIQTGQGRPPFGGTERPGRGAPPLEGRFVFAGSVLVGVVLAAFTIVLGAFALWLRQRTGI
jgi:type VI secretion system protein ImpK